MRVDIGGEQLTERMSDEFGEVGMVGDGGGCVKVQGTRWTTTSKNSGSGGCVSVLESGLGDR
jgi:membrane protein implicated in regulation of membrane protease activity